MILTEVIQYARRVLGSVRKVRFSNEPMIDIQDRLALLTVVSGLRTIAAFGFAEKENGGRLETLRGILTSQGLNCLVTKQIRHRTNEHLTPGIGDLVKVFDRVDTESYSRDSGRLLWVSRNSEHEEQIKKAVDRQVEVGVLLGYPACCVEHHQTVGSNFERAFAAAIIAAVGKESSAVERALLEDLKVEIPGDPTDNENMRRTDDLYPFVFHVSCNACLSSDSSPTASLNREYDALARQYERAFHALFREMAKTGVQIGQLISEAEKKNLRPNELTEPFRSQLRDLFDLRDRIYARFF
jgi:hypothetical protein